MQVGRSRFRPKHDSMNCGNVPVRRRILGVHKGSLSLLGPGAAWGCDTNVLPISVVDITNWLCHCPSESRGSLTG